MALQRIEAAPASDPINVVICGGGIIGVSTAYYLSKKRNIGDITIIEPYRIAGCASGKAGGFLAWNWCDGGPVVCMMQSNPCNRHHDH